MPGLFSRISKSSKKIKVNRRSCRSVKLSNFSKQCSLMTDRSQSFVTNENLMHLLAMHPGKGKASLLCIEKIIHDYYEQLYLPGMLAQDADGRTPLFYFMLPKDSNNKILNIGALETVLVSLERMSEENYTNIILKKDNNGDNFYAYLFSQMNNNGIDQEVILLIEQTLEWLIKNASNKSSLVNELYTEQILSHIHKYESTAFDLAIKHLQLADYSEEKITKILHERAAKYTFPCTSYIRVC